jgi:hypothetical protein
MGNWLDVISDPKVISTAGSIAESLFGDSGDKKTKSTSTSIVPVQPRTETTAGFTDFDMLYRDFAIANMDNLTQHLAEATRSDQSFLENTYRPYQTQITNQNTRMLPLIERTSAATLQQFTRDLVRNDHLKRSLRTNITDTSALDRLTASLDNVPTEEERVGEALTSVEMQFGKAGKQLAEQFRSRGQAVSQASARDLAFQKATAKAGAAGAAGEAARREQREAGLLGLQGASQAAAARATDVGSLAQLEQAGALGLQGIGQQFQVADPDRSAMGVAAELTGTAATQSFGTRQRQDQTTQIQEGIKMPNITSGAGQDQTGGVSGIAQPGTGEDRFLMGGTSESGGVLSNVKPITNVLGDSLSMVMRRFGDSK